MLFFSRALTEKDINPIRLGKLRTYRLSRNGQVLRFNGRLLSSYSIFGDSLEPEAQRQTHLESIAIFKTRTRYLLYYVVQYLNNDHISGRQVGIHAAPTLDELAAFIDSMHYVNKKSFAHAVIDDARAQDK